MKPKTCKVCKLKFIPERPLQSVCSYNCAFTQAKLYQQKKDKQAWAKEKSERKEKGMTKSDYEKLFQIVINQLVHYIDKNVPCIATGATTGKRNAGHRFSTKASPTIRYNLHNIHIQSEHSNNWKGGDNDRYDDGLIKVYGQSYRDYVHTLRQTKPINLTPETLKEKIAIAKLILKELKELGNNYTPEERINLRSQINEKIGIYQDNLYFTLFKRLSTPTDNITYQK